jgi:hypothetical protein
MGPWKQECVCCSKCRREFSSKSNLRRHVKNVHQSDEKFYCPYCSTSRAKRDDLIRGHIRSAHRDQWIAEGFPLHIIRSNPEQPIRPLRTMIIKPAFPEMTPISGELMSTLDGILQGANECSSPVSVHHDKLGTNTDILAEAMKVISDEDLSTYLPKSMDIATQTEPDHTRTRCRHGVPLPCMVITTKTYPDPEGKMIKEESKQVNCGDCCGVRPR